MPVYFVLDKLRKTKSHFKLKHFKPYFLHDRYCVTIIALSLLAYKNE